MYVVYFPQSITLSVIFCVVTYYFVCVLVTYILPDDALLCNFRAIYFAILTRSELSLFISVYIYRHDNIWIFIFRIYFVLQLIYSLSPTRVEVHVSFFASLCLHFVYNLFSIKRTYFERDRLSWLIKVTPPGRHDTTRINHSTNAVSRLFVYVFLS